MTRQSPRPHGGQTQIRTRLAVVEELLNLRAHTAESLRAQLHVEGVEVAIGTSRNYLQALRDEGRAVSRIVHGPANRAGQRVFSTAKTPRESIAAVVAEIEKRAPVFGDSGRDGWRRAAG